MPGALKVLLSRGVSKSVILSACRIAAKKGITPVEYLVRNGLVSPEAIYSAYAEHCGVPFLPKRSFRPRTINDRPIQMGEFEHGPMLVSVSDGKPVYVVAPDYEQFDMVRDHLRRNPDFAAQVRIAEPSALRFAATVMNSPASDLECRFPDLSAKPTSGGRTWPVFLAAFTAAICVITVPVLFWFYLLAVLVAVACLVSGLARLISVWTTWLDPLDFRLPGRFHKSDICWPRYSVLVPLYREAAVVRELLRALRQIDYPVSRLQILLLVETDDSETLAALRGEPLDRHMDILVVPRGWPKTKPRALSYGLDAATGDYVTVFDAEDRPAPDQLKKAALMFVLAPDDLACIQARLSIDNSHDGFFSRQFALEYACLFDQLLPWFYRNGLPFPLGGTSNHFRKSALDRVGGWDRHNVTEDADLGVRLARFGYRLAVLASSTYEEAPVRFSTWFAQRARWYKGWLQTICVHMRAPAELVKDLGIVPVAALAAVFVGSLFLIALHPVFLLLLTGYATGVMDLPWQDGPAGRVFLVIGAAAAAIGYLGAAVAAWAAAARRRIKPRYADLLAVPVYWVFTGFAFYRALWEFFRAPYHWNKTEHGQAKRRFRSSSIVRRRRRNVR
ncbi:MAG: glycosyltransferase [Roseibium sp.]|nr:glycosyltransferase [Roseibium sp.]